MEKSIESAVELIESARKPVLFIGGGLISSGAADFLREIVRQARIPVVSSLMGIGAMESANPLYLGMLGMHGTFAANKAVHQCDLLICIGVRFSDRVTGKISGFSPKSKKSMSMWIKLKSTKSLRWTCRLSVMQRVSLRA